MIGADPNAEVEDALQWAAAFLEPQNWGKKILFDQYRLTLPWSKRMMRLWTLIALLSSAIAADDSDYRQQILQAHIVAPAGQPVPFAQVARFLFVPMGGVVCLLYNSGASISESAT